MGGISRVQKELRDARAAAGVRKRFADVPILTIYGKRYTPAALVARLDGHRELLRRAASLEAQWRDAVREEREADREVRRLVRGLYEQIRLRFGDGRRVLADFGLEPHRKPGPKKSR